MSPGEKRILLMLARESISAFFSGSKPDLSKASAMDERLGAFVTLHMNGRLRGCIGYPEPVMPLYQAIAGLARSAAFDDTRFAPLKEADLEKVEIEISVLTKPKCLEPHDCAKRIKIGRDGLIIMGLGHGLLLPQVALEQGWNVHEFLEAVCMKAGMPRGSWKDPLNKIYAFQAEVFSENNINK